MAVIEQVGAPNVGFLADLYHLAKMGEDVAEVLTRYRDTIMHVQVADPPGRGAPGTGTLDFEPPSPRSPATGTPGGWGSSTRRRTRPTARGPSAGCEREHSRTR